MAPVRIKTGGGEGETQYKPLPADTYHMKIRDSKDVPSKKYFEDDGSPKLQHEITWEIVRLTEDQEDDPAVDPNRWVKQWFTMYYGVNRKDGKPSKYKVFVDKLRECGFLEEFDPADNTIDPDWFFDIEMMVTLDVNGEWNNVAMIAPVKRRRAAAQETKPARRNQPERATARNSAPVATADEEDEDDTDLF